MKELVYDEVLPALDGSEKELRSFAHKILERFRNPYIRHLWQSIALNAMSKWETRNLPSMLNYYNANDLPVYENPSPGTKQGGISTLEGKSLGCTQKGGTATVMDVLKYAEPIKVKGLNLLSSLGNDLVASSALGFSGCQLGLFTTGRGTPFGSFVPTMKILTNSAL